MEIEFDDPYIILRLNVAKSLRFQRINDASGNDLQIIFIDTSAINHKINFFPLIESGKVDFNNPVFKDKHSRFDEELTSELKETVERILQLNNFS